MTNKQFAETIEQFDTNRGNLISILQKVQEKEGFLSTETVSEVSKYLDITENDIYSVASFYAQFRFTPPGKHSIKACLGTACHVRGGDRIVDSIGRELNIQPGEVTEDTKFGLERVACVGCCALAPVVVIDGDVYGNMSPAQIKKVLSQYD